MKGGRCESVLRGENVAVSGDKQNRAPFSEERDAVFAVSRSLGAQ